jgi:hypothetical protein
MSKKLNSKTLQDEITIQRTNIVENMNSAEAKALFSSVADLYEEISEFENEVPPAAVNALTPHLKKVKDVLELMMQNPMSYVTDLKKQKISQKVTLKPVKG